MSPWPRSKTTESSPFTNTGVDYFGPLYIKNGGNRKKVWIGLFTCIVVRAAHLEVVEDRTAEHFLEAFRRFIARRGKPNKIISDNATTFKAAKNTIDIAQNDITRDHEVNDNNLKVKHDEKTTQEQDKNNETAKRNRPGQRAAQEARDKIVGQNLLDD